MLISRYYRRIQFSYLALTTLQAPKFDYVSNSKPSLFAYPSTVKPPKKEAVAKVATAVLSTTAKVKAREKKKAAAEGEAMDLVCYMI